MLGFEWDENKNKLNRKKHGIWFEEARTVFDAVNGRLFLDSEQAESHLILIGFSSGVRLLVVVHCYRKSESVVRIISAGKSTKRERNKYEKKVSYVKAQGGQKSLPRQKEKGRWNQSQSSSY